MQLSIQLLLNICYLNPCNSLPQDIQEKYNSFFHQNPEPRDPWTGVFDATPLGAACPQNPRGLLRLTHPDFDNWSEDCLNLDIYTKV